MKLGRNRKRGIDIRVRRGSDLRSIAVIGGGILLVSAIYQVQRRWRVNPTTWIGGAIMFIVGVMSWNGYSMPGGIFLPIAVFGGIIVLSAITGEL